MNSGDTNARERAHARYDPRRPLFSIHVPRTAGNSVRATLDHWFGKENVLPHYGDGKANTRPEIWTPGPLQCVHGHFNRRQGYGVYDCYRLADQFITFLRDPFDADVSLYFYLKKHAAVFHLQGKPFNILDRCPTVGSFLERQLAAELDAPSFLVYFPAELTTATWERDLEAFIHVGLSEQLDESLAILARKLGFPRVDTVRVNSADHDEEVDDAMRSRHRDRFPLEHEIYAWVRANHEEELRRMGLSSRLIA